MLPMGPGLIHVPWPRLLTLNMASTGMETEGVIALAVPWFIHGESFDIVPV